VTDVSDIMLGPVVTVLMACLTRTIAVKTHFVYWNSTNPMFRIENTDHIVNVNQGNLPWEYDQLHIICPQNTDEQHVIYSVPIEDFDNCRVTSNRPKIVAICNKPETFMYFTITFRSFSPTPGGMEFKAGQDYYFISTSTKRDLHRRVGGYCATHNMRMVFRVADRMVESDNNVIQVQVNKPRSTSTTTTTTTTTVSSRMWNARENQERKDYIYYYQPWHTRDRAKDRVKLEELTTNELLTALPFTSGSISLPLNVGWVLVILMVSYLL